MNQRPFHALRWVCSQVIIIGLLATFAGSALYGLFLLLGWVFS